MRGAYGYAIGGVAALVVLAFPVTAPAQPPVPAPPVVIDGGISSPPDLAMSIARDGTGAAVYLKDSHVFVARLAAGAFQPTERVDAGLQGPSSQPVVGAGGGGLLVVAFVNGGLLYVVDRAGWSSPYTAPSALAAGALNPSIEMTAFGKAYIAFTQADGSGDDVRAAYYSQGRWALEPSPLNDVPADDAGTAAGRPEVGAAGDGVAVVVWGEGGHVYSRRVWGTAPSVVIERADGPLPGCGEISADEPAVGVEGDSSYADVAFHETLSCGGQQQSRVLLNRLQGSVYDGLSQADGLQGVQGGGADDPQVAMSEYGQGWVTSERTTSASVSATPLGNNGVVASAAIQVGAAENVSPPYAIPSITGIFGSSLIAWQQTPGTAGPAELRVAYAPDGALGPEQVLSEPAGGPVDAAEGLGGGGAGGNAAVAWVQGEPGAQQIVAGVLYQPPSAIAASAPLQYVRTTQPLLAWSPAAGSWGPLIYTATVDGGRVGQTSGTALAVPQPLAQGSHSWQVTVSDPAGLSRTSHAATVFVDTVAPVATVRISGHRRAGSSLAIAVKARDPRPGSGIAQVTVRWGDGHVQVLHGHALHAYRRRGRYRVTVVVLDRAGNVTKLVRWVRIGR